MTCGDDRTESEMAVRALIKGVGGFRGALVTEEAFSEGKCH